jgi:hypothetical protein
MPVALMLPPPGPRELAAMGALVVMAGFLADVEFAGAVVLWMATLRWRFHACDEVLRRVTERRRW